jgi:integrase
MARPRSVSPPKYRKHRASGQAIVTLRDPTGRRKDYLLGPHGSAESKREYARLVAEWSAAGCCIPQAGPAPPDLSVNEMLVRFWTHVTAYYRHPDGRPTGEVDSFRLSLRPLKHLYGHTPARDFGPLALKAVRNTMIEAGLSRKLINQRVGRIRRCFKWAVGEQLVPANVFHGLLAVEGLAAGRSPAKDRPPVRPVDDATIEKTLGVVSRHVAAMIRLQRLSGARPQDVCQLRWCDIDTTGDVWVYRPPAHKTAWRGMVRAVYFGPQAQAILAGFRNDDPTAFVFSPRDARQEQYAAMRAARKTKVQPSQVSRARPRPNRSPGGRYSTNPYARHFERACKLPGIEPWRPTRLRHARATEIRQRYGLEEAQVSLGHSRADVTQVYAQRNEALALRVALETG